MIPYSTLNYNSLAANWVKSEIPSQRFNYLDPTSQIVVKIARHDDNKLHGWVPGDPNNPNSFKVVFELGAYKISSIVPQQAQKMRDYNTAPPPNGAGNTGGIVW